MNLEDSLRALKELVPLDASNYSPAQATQVFLAALHLLCDLKKDQSCLHRIQSESKSGNECQCPLLSQLPAIAAVHDAVLFRALVQCLQTAVVPASTDNASTTGGSEGGLHAGANGGGSNVAAAGSRKRSMSLSVDTTNKILKTSGHSHTSGGGGGSQHQLSPAPGSLLQQQQQQQQHRKGSMNTMMFDMSRVSNSAVSTNSRSSSSRKSPTFDLQAVAATILYTAFQHLDHWPLQLIRAYAEDCFGPRLWVDNKRCALLVENLALAHGGRAAIGKDGGLVGSITSNNAKAVTDAAIVANVYKRLDTLKNSNCSSSSPSTLPRGCTHSEGVESAAARKYGGSANKRLRLQRSLDSAPGNGNVGVIKPASEIGNSTKQSSKNDDGNSSSSGEEDAAADVAMKGTESARKTADGDCVREGLGSSLGTNASLDILYPIEQQTLDLSRVRQRYFGANLSAAHEAIAAALSDRVGVKSKQNSGLLHCLPTFTSIPGVRCLIAANLEKWLQSPALAGLARALFSSTVANMKKVDPPLSEDLQAIESIIGMRLKANQLNAHIENIAGIAKRLPVATVANRMYSKLLREVLVQADVAVGSCTDLLKMIGAIHREISPQFSYEAIAAALLTLLVHQGSSNTDSLPIQSRSDRDFLVKKLRRIIRALSAQLGSSFDGCLLVEGFMSLGVSTESWSARDEEDKARLMFQCISLSVSQFVKESGVLKLTPNEESALRRSLKSARILFLTWCCTEYGPHHSAKRLRKRLEAKQSNDAAGAGTPDYVSALGPREEGARETKRTASWLNTMRCLLFLEEAESFHLKHFLFPGGASLDDEAEWEKERPRLRLCYEYGGNVSDELCWIVLKSSTLSQGIDSEMAIQLLEHLFESCGRNRKSELVVGDPNIVWELYNLVQFTPDKPISIDSQDGSENADSLSVDIPRLAYPGLWWRVTFLALITCGHAPSKIGSVVWKEHPTLRALIKMVTSSRFRFPTVDCDDDAKNEAKQEEQTARDQENNVAEYLFLPPKQDKSKKEGKGSRVSRRILRQRQEKEAAREVAEANQRKKTLRAAQKSIMLWDPDGPARKPPRECVDLFLSVEKLFNLSEIFQKSVDPDFLLLTIGQTTRGAIERAYTWLIPIVSTIPAAIGRLPSSASCFLLLRAYGTEGDERKQLKELSAPLLRHVKDSLKGGYGVVDAVKAFDLLMTDVASIKPDRRRCARRVLNDAMAQSEPLVANPQSWMLSILHLAHAKSLVSDSVKHLSTASAFERGRVLRAIVLALEQHILYAEQHHIAVEAKFSVFLTRLISARPGVCAEAMDAFADLRSLVVRVLNAEFVDFMEAQSDPHADQQVVVRLFGSTLRPEENVHLPLSLLQSISVVLSIWKDDHAEADKEAALVVEALADALLRSAIKISNDLEDKGLATAKFIENAECAVPVESWIMLAKSQSNSLARRAAMTCPVGFLPRLLLCSGLPRESLFTIVDRLGRFGDEAANKKHEIFGKLLAPSAASEWDIGRVGSRRDISRRLLGRLVAYLRLFEVDLKRKNNEISTTFVAWLTEDCLPKEAKQSKQKKSKVSGSSSLASLSAASTILSSIRLEDPIAAISEPSSDSASVVMDNLKPYTSSSSCPAAEFTLDLEGVRSFITSATKEGKFVLLDERLEHFVKQLPKERFDSAKASEIELSELAIVLLKKYHTLNHPQFAATMILLKWVPRFSRLNGKSELWELIFRLSPDGRSAAVSSNLLSKCLSSWSAQHVSQCKAWIMRFNDDHLPVDINFVSIALFLTFTSGQPAAQVQLSSESPFDPDWASSKEFVVSGTVIAVKSLKQSTDHLESAMCRRNSLPTGFTLALLLARKGKKQLRSVCDVILREMANLDTTGIHHSALEVLFLRLYLFYPQWMDLGSSEARTALIQASEKQALNWVNWRSTFDDRIEDMLNSMSSGELRVAKSLSDLSRRQPLLLLRKLPRISSLLEADATIDIHSADLIEQRGKVTGQSLGGKLETKYHGKIVKIAVLCWGYAYVEPLWVALLDVLSSMPREVLFTCGLKVGLLEFFGIYLQLTSVQLQLLSANKAARLKGKLNEVFAAFRQCNSNGWHEWLGSKIGESEVRHVLMSCDFISPQEAIDSLKHT